MPLLAFLPTINPEGLIGIETAGKLTENKVLPYRRNHKIAKSQNQKYSF